MLGGSIWNLCCLLLFFIGILFTRADIAATAVIIFLLGIILKFLVFPDKKGDDVNGKK